VRATVKGQENTVQCIRSMFGQDMGTERKSIAIQRGSAATVYRFTLGEPLPRGNSWRRFCRMGCNLFVWDFWGDGAAVPLLRNNLAIH